MRFIALVSFAASVLAASRTTAPSGSIVVAKSGGDYSTVRYLPWDNGRNEC